MIGYAIESTKTDIDMAVTSAKNTFYTKWRKIDAFERAKMMYKFADLLDANA